MYEDIKATCGPSIYYEQAFKSAYHLSISQEPYPELCQENYLENIVKMNLINSKVRQREDA